MNSVEPLPIQPQPTDRRFIDIAGRTFGNLTVIGYVGKNKNNHRWLCRCVCGNQSCVITGNLKSGMTQSCGCLQRQRTRSHGMARTRIYKVWHSMVSRCTKPSDSAFKYYGARGITVCDAWLTFEGFYADMGDCPLGLTLDRLDNNRGYSPENCAWVSRQVQSNNTRRNHILTMDGETLTIAEWARKLGMDYDRAYRRLVLS